MKYTGHSTNVLLLENSNCYTCSKDLVAVFILEFRRVSLLPGVNILLLLLLLYRPFTNACKKRLCYFDI